MITHNNDSHGTKADGKIRGARLPETKSGLKRFLAGALLVTAIAGTGLYATRSKPKIDDTKETNAIIQTTNLIRRNTPTQKEEQKQTTKITEPVQIRSPDASTRQTEDTQNSFKFAQGITLANGGRNGWGEFEFIRTDQPSFEMRKDENNGEIVRLKNYPFGVATEIFQMRKGVGKSIENFMLYVNIKYIDMANEDMRPYIAIAVDDGTHRLKEPNRMDGVPMTSDYAIIITRGSKAAFPKGPFIIILMENGIQREGNIPTTFIPKEGVEYFLELVVLDKKATFAIYKNETDRTERKDAIYSQNLGQVNLQNLNEVTVGATDTGLPDRLGRSTSADISGIQLSEISQ